MKQPPPPSGGVGGWPSSGMLPFRNILLRIMVMTNEYLVEYLWTTELEQSRGLARLPPPGGVDGGAALE